MSPLSPQSIAKQVKVWVVADRRLVLESLCFFLKKQRQFALVNELDGDRSRLADAREGDVVVVYLEASDSAEIIRDLHADFPTVKIIAVTDANSSNNPVTLLKIGAVGVVQATQNLNSLVEAIKRASDGETWLNQEILTHLLEEDGGSGRPNRKFGPVNDSLTPREIEVVSMVGEGLKSKMIAERLSISGATVRHHLSSIYGKLGVDDRLNLVIYAIKKGLVQLDDNGNGK